MTASLDFLFQKKYERSNRPWTVKKKKKKNFKAIHMTKIATGFSWIKKPGAYPDNEMLKQYRLKNYIQPFMLMQPFYNLGYVKGHG